MSFQGQFDQLAGFGAIDAGPFFSGAQALISLAAPPLSVDTGTAIADSAFYLFVSDAARFVVPAGFTLGVISIELTANDVEVQPDYVAEDGDVFAALVETSATNLAGDSIPFSRRYFSPTSLAEIVNITGGAGTITIEYNGASVISGGAGAITLEVT